jgi:hypothetical protein
MHVCTVSLPSTREGVVNERVRNTEYIFCIVHDYDCSVLLGSTVVCFLE